MTEAEANAAIICGECGEHVADVSGNDFADIERQTFNGMKCRAKRCVGLDRLRIHMVKEST